MKREELVEATVKVLKGRGVAGCTGRAIAEQSGVSKSAIHYYFEDIDYLVELAWERLMAQYLGRCRAAAASKDDPFQALWAAAEVYLDHGAQRGEAVPMIAFDYVVAATRRGNFGATTKSMDETSELVHELVAATGIDDAPRRSDVLLSALIGAAIRAQLAMPDLDGTLTDLSEVVGIPRRGPVRTR